MRGWGVDRDQEPEMSGAVTPCLGQWLFLYSELLTFPQKPAEWYLLPLSDDRSAVRTPRLRRVGVSTVCSVICSHASKQRERASQEES